MKAVMKRAVKNYLKNPVFWIGFLIILLGVYQEVSPYLGIHWFTSDEEIRQMQVEDVALNDLDVMQGYIPANEEQQKEAALQEIGQTLLEEFDMSSEEVQALLEKFGTMKIPEIISSLEEMGYYGSLYTFEDNRYVQGTAEEVNQYMEERFAEHPYSWYVANKFADFAGLYLGFAAAILLVLLFFRDTRKDTWELLHTRPVTTRQYVLGKAAGGFAVMALILAALTLLFTGICLAVGIRNQLPVNPLDIPMAAVKYILPNLLMIVSVYAVVALAFRNPLPGAPVLFLYLLYSNMGTRGPDGRFGYYGRPLAIMVRFPGDFLETAAPSITGFNQIFLLVSSAILLAVAIRLWELKGNHRAIRPEKRRRVS
ncbi:MAG TPA: ABC transporter permease subunit [Candidatus Pullilachnospira intestinigallinarum]|nr:ABC transporter permease subunit [Candidatus Pullilachnospira intestinigallinarum]